MRKLRCREIYLAHGIGWQIQAAWAQSDLCSTWRCLSLYVSLTAVPQIYITEFTQVYGLPLHPRRPNCLLREVFLGSPKHKAPCYSHTHIFLTVLTAVCNAPCWFFVYFPLGPICSMRAGAFADLSAHLSSAPWPEALYKIWLNTCINDWLRLSVGREMSSSTSDPWPLRSPSRDLTATSPAAVGFFLELLSSWPEMPPCLTSPSKIRTQSSP